MRTRIRRQKHVVVALQWYSPTHHRGIARYAREAGWSLDLAWVHSKAWHPPTQLDGMVCLLLNHGPLVDQIMKIGVPIVDMCSELDHLPLPRVLQDDAGIGEAVARHFIERGFRSFAYCAPTTMGPASLRRLHGFREMLHKCSCDCALVTPRGGPRIPGASPPERLAHRLGQLPKPLAIMARNDDYATEVLRACHLVGLRVPEDVAIVGCDNDELTCDLAAVPLSSADSNLEGHGYAAAALLDRLMKGAKAPRHPVCVPHKGVVVRQSSDILAVDHRGVSEAMRMVQLQYTNPSLSIEHIAQQVGITRRGLDRACRHHLQHTVSEKLKRLRLDHALALLRSGKMKVHEVACACGYSRTKHLRNSVLRTTGLTPIRYRQDNAKKIQNRHP